MLDYTVETFYNLVWTTVSSITNSNNTLQYITFPPVNATRLRISVTRDEVAEAGEFTRINEVYPLFANLTSSAPTSSPTPPASILPTHCPETKKFTGGAIAGGVVGGAAVGITIGAVAAFLLLRRRKKTVETMPPPVKMFQGGVHELGDDPVGKIIQPLSLSLFLSLQMDIEIYIWQAASRGGTPYRWKLAQIMPTRQPRALRIRTCR